MIERLNGIVDRLLGNELFIIITLLINIGVFAIGYYFDSLDIMLISTSSFALILFSAVYRDSLDDA